MPPYTYGTGLGPVLDEGPDRLDHPARAAVRARAPAVGKREELALGQQLDFHDPRSAQGWKSPLIRGDLRQRLLDDESRGLRADDARSDDHLGG